MLQIRSGQQCRVMPNLRIPLHAPRYEVGLNLGDCRYHRPDIRQHAALSLNQPITPTLAQAATRGLGRRINHPHHRRIPTLRPDLPRDNTTHATPVFKCCGTTKLGWGGARPAPGLCAEGVKFQCALVAGTRNPPRSSEGAQPCCTGGRNAKSGDKMAARNYFTAHLSGRRAP